MHTRGSCRSAIAGKAPALLLCLCLGLWPLHNRALGATASDLSRWLDGQLMPQLTELLSRHPRYAGQSVVLVNDSGDALADALLTVINSHLAATPGIALVASEGLADGVLFTGSIDQLHCQTVEAGRLQLLIHVAQPARDAATVSVELRETGSLAGAPGRVWRWTGVFSREERNYARAPGLPASADGSLAAPWSAADIESAARSLSRDFACQLRPAVVTRVGLQWQGQSGLPAVVRDTVNSSRHFLGSLREVSVAAAEPDYIVAVELKPFRDDTWQLWLMGSPRVPLAAPVQAVTYFRVENLQHRSQPELPTRPLPAGTAADYLQVEMLGATQSERGRGGADLSIALRLVNRGEWPIAYSLRVSGGHFNHCIARPAYYRHDRYGKLSGTLAPGASQVQRLVVEGLQHRPYPWFGMPRCAGSTDFQALENYEVEGYRVTDYVRWDL